MPSTTQQSTTGLTGLISWQISVQMYRNLPTSYNCMPAVHAYLLQLSKQTHVPELACNEFRPLLTVPVLSGLQ